MQSAGERSCPWLFVLPYPVCPWSLASGQFSTKFPCLGLTTPWYLCSFAFRLGQGLRFHAYSWPWLETVEGFAKLLFIVIFAPLFFYENFLTNQSVKRIWPRIPMLWALRFYNSCFTTLALSNIDSFSTGRIWAHRRRPRASPWYLTWQKGLYRCDYVKDFEMGRLSCIVNLGLL